MAWRVLEDESAAEDIASAALLHIGERMEDGHGPGALEGSPHARQYWAGLLPIVAYGKAIDAYRRADIPAGLAQEGDWLGDLLQAEASDYDDVEFSSALDGAVRALETPNEFILTELRGLTQREAGLVLSIPHRTVRHRAERARQIIAKEIAA